MTTPGIRLSPDVERALEQATPVVALETSVLAQGLPPPRNAEAVERMEAALGASGAHPAWTWVAGGAVRVGASAEELRALMEPGAAVKIARRDLPIAVGNAALGATTVSASLWAGAAAGIEVAATGGIGGVHRGTGDVSADLFELARTPGVLVCAGPKTIVDPLATLERLEELGVAVVGFGTDRLPFFYVREAAAVRLEHVVTEPSEVAAVARARRALGIRSTILVCRPVPEAAALDPGVVEAAIAECEPRSREEGVTGKAVTPFLLRCLAERTDGATLEANLALLEANCVLAGEIAAALASGA